MNYDIIIGVDPDIDRSGVAELEVNSRCMEAGCLSFYDLLDYLGSLKSTYPTKSVLVVVEASWKSTNVWHLTAVDNRHIASKKGYAVGRNHQTGLRQITRYGYPYRHQEWSHRHYRQVERASVWKSCAG